MQRSFYRFYWKMQEKLLPGLKYSQEIYEDVLTTSVAGQTKWLDLGCGHQILPGWRKIQESNLVKRCCSIVGLDYNDFSLRRHENIRLKVRGDITNLPFLDNSFNLVTANMVVEHLSLPENQFREVNRVLTSGGLFIVHTPNKFGYTTVLSMMLPDKVKNLLIRFFQGRSESDVFNTYFRANSRKKIYSLAGSVGFEVMDIKMIVSSAQFVMIPPLVVLELIWIKLLMMKLFKPLRPNMIVVLKKRN